MTATARKKSPTPQVAYAPGARVVVRGEEWIIRRAQQTSAGTTAVHVSGQSELVRNKDAIFLDDLDKITVLRPEDTALVVEPSPQYRRSILYLESLLRQTPPTGAKLSIGHLGAMNSALYQLVPATQALAAPRARILIADAVGLGKTIEVGILLSELIRRGRGRRILVVALRSVLEQFQKELWARFTLPLVRLDSVGLERVQRKIPANHNPFYRFDRVIISVDTLKKDEKYRRFLEKCHWDAIVIDECQHIAERGAGGPSQRALLGSLLARTCDSLILTSATPHDGSAESFASLMNLLDPTAVADPDDFTRQDIEHLYVRRFKKDVARDNADAFSERELHPQRVPASGPEDAVYEALRQARFLTINPRLPGTRDRTSPDASTAAPATGADGRSALFRTLLLKSFLSSPDALSSTLKERHESQQRKHAALEREARLTPAFEQAYQADQEQLDILAKAAQRVSPRHNTKLQHLVKLLTQFGLAKKQCKERVVVFSERIPTLEFLKQEIAGALGLSDDQIDVFHGSLDDQAQQKLVRDFGTENSPVRILLASDAASQGINLHHFCHRLVHYDIPWSLITLEQRNGRIDRYGQPHRPELHYLLSVPGNPELQGDLRVLDILVEKEHQAHKNLGDVRWLMGLNDAAEEEARIIEGVSRHEPPEQIVKPPPGPKKQLSLLERLMATPTAAPGEEASRLHALPETEAPFRLYADDLSYVKAAYTELLANQPEDPHPSQKLEPPQWHDNISGLQLKAPPDLQQRYAYLPPELRRDDDSWTFKLTANRDLVQKSLQKAREQSDAWPEFELLWELHPIVGWINDRVVCHFARHEAPVIRVSRGLAAKECVYVFQGVLSNQQSQPILVDWFGVRTVPRQPAAVVSLRDLSALVGLAEPLVNPPGAFDTEPFREHLPSAVQCGEDHMLRLREKRAKQLIPELKEQKKRLAAWLEGRMSVIEHAKTESSRNGRGLNSTQQAKWDSQKQHAERVVQDRSKWLDSMKTIAEPYLRLALVIGTTSAKGTR